MTGKTRMVTARRLLCIAVLIMIIFTVLSLQITARADAIIEPRNDFYSAHKGRCVAVGRYFCANGRNGAASMRKEPGAKREIFSVDNGAIIFIDATYDYNGEIWGVADTQYSGWILMDELLVVYDYISFEEDHGDEFYTYKGSYDAVYEAEDIALWTWPGSGGLIRMLEPSRYPAFSPENILTYKIASKTWKDDEGREWMFMLSKYATGWICISDLANTDIPAFNEAPPPVLRQPGDEETPADGQVPAGGLSLPVIIIIMVVAVAAVTALLIRQLWGRKR